MSDFSGGFETASGVSKVGLNRTDLRRNDMLCGLFVPKG
jgi:hypothetical protein